MKKSLALLLLLALCTLCLSGCQRPADRRYRKPEYEPAVTRAEFPFELSCTVAGERYDVQGVYVCEYDGAYSVLEVGWTRDWDVYVYDTNGKLIAEEPYKTQGFFFSYSTEYVDKCQVPITEYDGWTVCFSLPSGTCMMNDTENLWYLPCGDSLGRDSLFCAKNEDGEWIYHDRVVSTLPVELLRYDIAPPIDNAFPQSK